MVQFTVEFGKGGTAPATADGRLDAPAFHRNHEPIWNAIGPFLATQQGDVLELGSGTGQHIATYAGRASHLTWWPSDMQEPHLKSIAAWREQAALPNLRAPQSIDLTDAKWTWAPGGTLAVMLCCNVLHISPFTVSQNLLAGAARQLTSDGRLFVYGPFVRDGAHTAPSNATFDASLRMQDPAWGVRDTSDLAMIAAENGLRLAEITAMPANNLVLTFARAG